MALPCILVAAPLPYKNLDGYVVHIAPVKSSTVGAKNLTLIVVFEFLNG